MSYHTMSLNLTELLSPRSPSQSSLLTTFALICFSTLCLALVPSLCLAMFHNEYLPSPLYASHLPLPLSFTFSGLLLPPYHLKFNPQMCSKFLFRIPYSLSFTSPPPFLLSSAPPFNPYCLSSFSLLICLTSFLLSHLPSILLSFFPSPLLIFLPS